MGNELYIFIWKICLKTIKYVKYLLLQRQHLIELQRLDNLLMRKY